MGLLLVLLLAGCGTGDQAPSNEAEAETKGGGSEIEAGKMDPSLVEVSPLVYKYEVKNQTEKDITLKFSSSQRFDYSVESKDGEEIFLFSSVAAFLQVLGEEIVKTGEALTYDIDLHELSLEPGEYILATWMTPKDGEAFKESIKFTVE